MANQGLRKLVIVGGGYLGAGLARRMDQYANVTLVEPREAFVHNSALIRALVQPHLLPQLMLPYDGLLRNGRVVRQRVTAVDANSVTLGNGEELQANAIVVATGSRYALPFKPTGDSVAALVNDCNTVHQQLLGAKTIIIVGAGAVGIELAGEIASAMPGKKVTLVNSHRELLPQYPHRLGQQIQSKLEQLGVEVINAQYALRLQQHHAPFCGRVQLCSGQVLFADMVIPALGSSACNELLARLPDIQIGSSGRIITDPWMRPSPAMTRVFAAGDVAECGDGMTIVATIRQIPWLAQMLRTVLNGHTAEKSAPYSPWPLAPVLLPLNADTGSSWLPLPGSSLIGAVEDLGVVGDWMTSLIKGKNLFITKYRKQFGLGEMH